MSPASLPVFDPSELIVTGNQYTDQYIASARELGLEVKVMHPRSGMTLISGHGKQLTVLKAAVGMNNYAATLLSYNKFATSQHLRRGGFRVPDSALFNTTHYQDPQKFIWALLQSSILCYPLVLKPVRGLGGRHVFAGLQDETDLNWAADRIWHDVKSEVMLERHIQGNHFRVKVMDGAVIDLIHRIPASVTGDGDRTIRQLVEQNNQIKSQSRLGLLETGERTDRLLRQAGLTLESVLPQGQTQFLRVESNMEVGGDSTRMSPQVIPRAVQEYFSRVSRYTELRWIGLDFICDDITSEEAHRTGYINETGFAHIPNGFAPGRSREDYLRTSREVLSRYFEL